MSFLESKSLSLPYRVDSVPVFFGIRRANQKGLVDILSFFFFFFSSVTYQERISGVLKWLDKAKSER